uniref:Uncharacterized protein n=1 Tax=viral metagenome TaxID=1070528 RepID=A0A6C0ADC3_9ZZZZ
MQETEYIEGPHGCLLQKEYAFIIQKEDVKKSIPFFWLAHFTEIVDGKNVYKVTLADKMMKQSFDGFNLLIEKTLEDIDRKSKEGKTSYEIIMDKNETKKLSYISSHFRRLGFEVSHCENKVLSGNISLFIKW